MDLQGLTRGRLVHLGLRASAKTDAIETLLDYLVAEGEVPTLARDSILSAILTRERRLSTGLEHGVAIPHGITDAIEDEVAAVGIFPEGVPFDASDGLPARIVILLITPELKRYRHVSNLAEIARQLRRTTLRERLLAARSLEDAVTALSEPCTPDEPG
jgi:PTS system nitrogen regulatory IIA component